MLAERISAPPSVQPVKAPDMIAPTPAPARPLPLFKAASSLTDLHGVRVFNLVSFSSAAPDTVTLPPGETVQVVAGGADEGAGPRPPASAVAAALAVVIALMRLSTCRARSARIKGW